MPKPHNGKEIVVLETGYRFTVGGSAVCTRDGRVLMHTTVPETFGQANLQLTRAEMRESTDDGRSWGPPQVLLRSIGELALLPGPMLRLASGRIFLIVGHYGGYDFENHDPEKSLFEFWSQTSDDDGRTWSPMRRIDQTWRYMNCPLAILQLQSGRILIPSGYLTPFKGRSVISALYSDDGGATWTRSPSVLDVGGSGFESGPSEPTAVELPDGRVWMLMRTQTGAQWESFSDDGGATWGEPQPSRFPSSSAPATFLKLSSGRIIIVWDNSVAAPYARHSLVIAASDDGGKTFRGFREIAHVESPAQNLERRWGVAYAFPCEAPDGTLLVAFNNGDWKYMHLRVARIDPDWIVQSDVVENFVDGMGGWCAVGAGGDSIAPPEDDRPGVSLQLDWVETSPSGIARNFPLLERGTFTCTLSVFGAPSFLLWHNSFLDPGKFEDACLRVRFAADGAVYIGSGTPAVRSFGESKFTPEYSYTAYPVTVETKYPTKVGIKQRFTLGVRVDVAQKAAWVSIDDGPEIASPLHEILGLCYFGLAADKGGGIRLRGFETHSA